MGGYLFEEGKPTESPVDLWFGFIAEDVADFADKCFITIADFDPDKQIGPCFWQPRNGTSLPKRGDGCVVSIDNRQQFWVLAWWPNDEIVPKTTTGLLSDGPPAGPNDGDIWIATMANGVRWQFQYNATSISAYKWEYIGGSELSSEVAASSTTNSGVYVDPNGGVCSITLLRAGDYDIRFGANLEISTPVANAQIVYGTSIAGAAPDNNYAITLYENGGVAVEISAHRERRKTDIAANSVIKNQWSVVGATVQSMFGQWLKIAPVRIS